MFAGIGLVDMLPVTDQPLPGVGSKNAGCRGRYIGGPIPVLGRQLPKAADHLTQVAKEQVRNFAMIVTLSPGITVSTPSGSCRDPVTCAVLKENARRSLLKNSVSRPRSSLESRYTSAWNLLCALRNGLKSPNRL